MTHSVSDPIVQSHRGGHEGHDHEDDHHEHEASGSMTAARMIVIALCGIAVWFEFPDAYPPVLAIGDQVFIPFSYYGLVGLVFGGWPIFEKAYESVLARKMTMELSMALAILSGAYGGYFFVALMITFFVIGAEHIEGLTVERGRRAIRELLELLPTDVPVRRAGVVRDIRASDVVVGDIIVVAPGARIPADGTVVSGHSFVDEAQITGESVPSEKTSGARVLAGTINQAGALEIRATRLGKDTSYGKIIEAIERAERSRAPIQRLSDQLAGYIVIVALAFAALEYYLTRSLIDAATVIIVAGACGVAAGTPLAILGGIGRAARLGAIVKGGVHLELLGKVDTVVFDKTGTVTFGQPEVQRIIPVAGVSPEAVLGAAVTAELRSEHPFGKAIIRHAGTLADTAQNPDHFRYVPGRGIAAQAGSEQLLVGSEAWMADNTIAVPPELGGSHEDVSRILIARNGSVLGAIELADQLRPQSPHAVKSLKRMGIQTVLLTGDTPAVAQSIARRLGVDDVQADLLPEQKVSYIRGLVERGRVVAMVGDGVNDAPALTAANVGIAMGSGTDVARESADIVLLGNDLARFVDTVTVSQRARRIIWFNFAGTVLVDVIGVALVFGGYVGPVLAAIVHTGSELAFILNSARLLPRIWPLGGRTVPAQELHASAFETRSVAATTSPAAE